MVARQQQLDKKKVNKKKGRTPANVVSRLKHEKVLSDLEHARKKWHDAIKEIKKIQKIFKAKLAEKVNEMTLKIKYAQIAGFEAAQRRLEKEHERKEAARQKFIEVAHAKFEKSYSKKLSHKIASSKLAPHKNSIKEKPKAKAKVVDKVSANKTASSKRRGRPSKVITSS